MHEPKLVMEGVTAVPPTGCHCRDPPHQGELEAGGKSTADPLSLTPLTGFSESHQPRKQARGPGIVDACSSAPARAAELGGLPAPGYTRKEIPDWRKECLGRAGICKSWVLRGHSMRQGGVGCSGTGGLHHSHFQGCCRQASCMRNCRARLWHHVWNPAPTIILVSCSCPLTHLGQPISFSQSVAPESFLQL